MSCQDLVQVLALGLLRTVASGQVCRLMIEEPYGKEVHAQAIAEARGLRVSQCVAP